MKLNLMSIVMLFIAVLVSNFISTYIIGFLGVAGGIMATVAFALILYAVYGFITKYKLSAMGAVWFTVFVVVANFLAGFIGGFIGFDTGSLLSTALFVITLFFVISYMGKGKVRGK